MKNSGKPHDEEPAASGQAYTEDDAERMKKLTRAQLLELLVMESREREETQAKLDEALKELEDKRLRLGEAGNIAEASLKLNDVFAKAQAAADQYLENIKSLEEETKAACAKMKEETKHECAEMKKRAEEECAKMKEASKAEVSVKEVETKTEKG